MERAEPTIAALLLDAHGLDLSKYDPSFLEKSIRARGAEKGFCRDDYCALLAQCPSEAAVLGASLQINYSEFFRNSLTFALLERIVLPSIVREKRKTQHKEIRIWSAACAGGQEAYSLAILLEELRNGDLDKFKYRIIATDQSEEQVKEASHGEYAAAALNNLSLKRVGKWFSKEGDRYAIDEELKKCIDFSTFDLLNENLSCPSASIFGDFDLIICANLLFYYQDVYRKIILNKAVKALSEDGYLVTGEAEREIVLRARHHEIFPQSAIFQKRKTL